ncbi:MAG: hypothetical protein ABEL76_13875 [Bradymonadaceae bacterium]
MTVDDTDIREILDADKEIVENVEWSHDDSHAAWCKFQVPVESDSGHPLRMAGNYNPLAEKLSFTLIHPSEGRIYSLDLGQKHHNPTCEDVGSPHKHQWTEQFDDKKAYEPEDIEASSSDVEQAWAEFRAEANIVHRGEFLAPPPIQTRIDA